MSKPLLDTSNPLYLKRLAKELNSLSDGFYNGSLRYTCARYRAGRLQGRRLGAYLDPRDPRNGRAIWNELIPESVNDAYGCNVCASRSV